MMVTDLLIHKLMEMEGLRLDAYVDAAGVWTIGYGHTKNVRQGDKISEYWAKELLMQDVAEVERQVKALGVAKTQGQFDALVSFAFNLGIGNLKRSTLLKCIREGRSMREIKRQFMRWVVAGGKRLKGLERRRAWEVQRFFE
ncbi:MAG: lysozyme [Prevotella sp.]|jgi:lysozyme|nr:lysozyme [Prevotella sp.]